METAAAAVSESGAVVVVVMPYQSLESGVVDVVVADGGDVVVVVDCGEEDASAYGALCLRGRNLIRCKISSSK